MPNYDTNIIDEYLSGRMKSEQQQSFEKRLQVDTDLQSALQDRAFLLSTVKAIGDIEMKKRAKRIHQLAMQTKPKVRSLTPWRYVAAAAIAMLLCFGIWFWLQPAASNDLYAQYYTPYELSFSTRDIAAEQQLSTASQLYTEGDFAAAVPILEELLNKDINNKDRLRLAAGISLLETNRDQEALPYFEYLINASFSPYAEQGLWYAALSSIRQNNIPTAKNYLRQLAQNKNAFKSEEAEELLSSLE